MHVVSLHPFMYVYVGEHVCVGVLRRVLSMYLYLFVCVSRVLQHFGFVREIRTFAGDPDTIRIRVVVDPTHRRSEDRCLGWSVDQCQFVQWRPDG